jgi:membrane protein
MNFKEIIKQTYIEFYRKNIPFLSAAVAYYAFLSVIPFFLLLVSVLGIIGNYLPRLGIDLNLFLATLLGKYGTQVYRFVQRIISRRFSYGFTGLVALLIGFSLSITPVEHALKIVFEAERSKSFFKQRFFAIGIFLLIILLLVLANGMLVFVQGTMRWLGPELKIMGHSFDFRSYYLLTGFTLPVFFVLSTYLLFYLSYRFLTVKRPSRKNTFLVAFFSAVLLEFARQAYLFYLYRFPVWDLIYGTFGFFIVTLVFIYLSSTVFLIGAIVIKQLEKSYGNNMQNRV